MKIEDIKIRDKWTCASCGGRFVNLKVYCYTTNMIVHSDANDIDGKELITLCEECIQKIKTAPGPYREIFKNMLNENKIVLVGDIHGKFNSLNAVLMSEEPFDFFITTGDIGAVLGQEDLAIIDRWKDKGFQVVGDDDIGATFTQLDLYSDISGIHVAALSGMIKSRTFIKDTRDNISFREILYLSHLQSPDILVTHQAPTGFVENCGEQVLQELLNYLVPKIYIFGHLHVYKLKFHLSTFCISLPMVNKGHAVAYFRGNELRNLEQVFKKGKKVIRV